jgi:hypothetical protein
MALELVKSSPMFTPRQRERRQALPDLLAALARAALDRKSDVSLMRSTFEQMLGRIVPVRTVRLREATGRWGRPDGRVGSESITLDVPVPAAAPKNVLEATFDPASGLGEWDFQMLGMAAQLAGLVVEIERCRLQASRAAPLEAYRPRRDHASGLIGLTPPMIALRDSIERVAATDFVVLLEGGSSAELGSELRP